MPSTRCTCAYPTWTTHSRWQVKSGAQCIQIFERAAQTFFPRYVKLPSHSFSQFSVRSWAHCLTPELWRRFAAPCVQQVWRGWHDGAASRLVTCQRLLCRLWRHCERPVRFAICLCWTCLQTDWPSSSRSVRVCRSSTLPMAVPRI